MKPTYDILTTSNCNNTEDYRRVALRCVHRKWRKPGMIIQIKSSYGERLFVVNEDKTISQFQSEPA